MMTVCSRAFARPASNSSTRTAVAQEWVFRSVRRGEADDAQATLKNYRRSAILAGVEAETQQDK